MQIQSIIEAIYGSALSTAIRENTWIVPTVQSIHICAISVVIGSSLLVELRLAGVIATDEPVYTVVRRYLPWMWGALGLLLLTGVIMVIGEPERELGNRVFWIKMALVLGGVGLSLFFRRPFLNPSKAPPGFCERWAKPLAWVLLGLWVAVIFSGRWIAYT